MDAHLECTQEGAHSKLSLSGEMTIYSAAELKPQLLQALHDSQNLEINLAGVEEVDTAGFQLLLLLKREAKTAGKTLSLVAHSAATVEVLDLLKMEAYFGDPVVLAS